ncbi:hypothetical protein HBI56_128860 [Parastagonospora nodorum]|uniref:Uncharacterized protein n=1 Tax=Phaeosphaeria nodorum (strain SN15 / ATCC MYA-4574 / FGSC 10173) TaxID=321614 RepID=A0A7U2HZA5_PHANO|nr:hypothetical protein HBH56_155030 [Parastagonospora nodorum]QRC95894.1 hypothetical protein JI435_432890 [Parastagonospora nodorum SN15]KAH3926653.1 hypothetical protein HBH54_162660 [Parastagonospora nodorum]KAH3943214.1 hypothetical protein HBH53_176500 [Parastagonospora nodorum]KAH3970376.1 hypothetical protein HBH52_168210 [Parastagonospora nodorum]
MLFFRALSLLSILVPGSAKPLLSGVVPRQDRAPLTWDQTICGDIVIDAQKGELTYHSKQLNMALISSR